MSDVRYKIRHKGTGCFYNGMIWNNNKSKNMCSFTKSGDTLSYEEVIEIFRIYGLAEMGEQLKDCELITMKLVTIKPRIKLETVVKNLQQEHIVSKLRGELIWTT